MYDCHYASYPSLLQGANIPPISSLLGVVAENLLQWRGQVCSGAVTAAAVIQVAPEQSAAHTHRRGAHLRYSRIVRKQLAAPREKAHNAIHTQSTPERFSRELYQYELSC